MKAAIDSAGRVVVPKAIREELRLEPGCELNIRVSDGALILEPEATPVALVRRGRVVIAKPKEVLPKLGQDDVRDVLERARR